MNFYYTARTTYDKSNNEGNAWEKYIEWSRLFHIKELVSLDYILNSVIFDPDRNSELDFSHIIQDELYETGFFTPLDYVLQKVKHETKFNLLAGIIKPTQDCTDIVLQDFEFVGYDLLDKCYDISALTNCGGFDETFLPSELNEFGLIGNFARAVDINTKLFENNSEEYHADTNIIAVWRHKTIGRLIHV